MKKKREVAFQQAYLNNLSQKLTSLDKRFTLFSGPSRVELMPRARCWVFMTNSIMESGAKKARARGLGGYKWLTFCHSISIVEREDLLKGNVHYYAHNGILSFAIPEQISRVRNSLNAFVLIDASS